MARKVADIFAPYGARLCAHCFGSTVARKYGWKRCPSCGAAIHTVCMRKHYEAEHPRQAVPT